MSAPLPCPFCGGAPEVIEGEHGPVRWCRVECDEDACPTAADPVRASYTGDHGESAASVRDRALRRWNTRAPAVRAHVGPVSVIACCRCGGPTGVIVAVRRALPFACRGRPGSYHGSWLEPKERAEHVVCEACEPLLPEAMRLGRAPGAGMARLLDEQTPQPPNAPHPFDLDSHAWDDRDRGIPWADL